MTIFQDLLNLSNALAVASRTNLMSLEEARQIWRTFLINSKLKKVPIARPVNKKKVEKVEKKANK